MRTRIGAQGRQARESSDAVDPGWAKPQAAIVDSDRIGGVKFNRVGAAW